MTTTTTNGDETAVSRDRWTGLLDDLDHLIAETAAEPMPMPGVDVDVAGRLRHASRKLSGLARGIESEIEPGTEGDLYVAKEERKAERSYNTGRLIDAFGEAGWSMMDLVRADALRLGWMWSNLRNAASKAGVTLAITPNEIDDNGDLDGPMVGEFWKHSTRIVGKEQA